MTISPTELETLQHLSKHLHTAIQGDSVAGYLTLEEIAERHLEGEKRKSFLENTLQSALNSEKLNILIYVLTQSPIQAEHRKLFKKNNKYLNWVMCVNSLYEEGKINTPQQETQLLSVFDSLLQNKVLDHPYSDLHFSLLILKSVPTSFHEALFANLIPYFDASSGNLPKVIKTFIENEDKQALLRALSTLQFSTVATEDIKQMLRPYEARIEKLISKEDYLGAFALKEKKQFEQEIASPEKPLAAIFKL